MFPRRIKVSPNLKLFTGSNRSQSETKPEPRALRVLFIFAHIILSLNYGFLKVKSYKARVLLKCISVLQSLVQGGYILYILLPSPGALLWITTDLITHIFFVILVMSCRYTYYDFLSDLQAFDFEMKVDSASYRLELKIALISLLVYLYTLGIFAVIYVDSLIVLNMKDILNMILYTVVLSSADFVRFTFVFLFFSTYWRMRKFKQFVKNGSADVIACQFLYKHITDITEKAKNNYNIVFLVSLICNFILMGVIVIVPFATNTVKTSSPLKLTSNLMMVFKNLFTMFAPTYSAGLLASEVEKLVLVLRDRALLEKDEKTQKDIRRFISYIEARPMKFTVYNIIPLDWNLPIIIINLAITYLIVMIQFTHNY